MAVTKRENTQSSIEDRLLTPLTITLKNDDTFRRLFGDLEKWIFETGTFRFMLNPINRRWLFWHDYHNEWEDTGHYAGEVRFVWDGNKLLTPKVSSSTSDPDHAALANMVSIDGSGHQHPVFANTLIGNERNSDIKIESTDSKGLILQHAGGYTFFAMGEKAVIFVNNNVVPPEGVLLHDGDRITIARTQFDFVQISQPDSKGTEKTQTTSAPKPPQKSPEQTIDAGCHNCHAYLEDNVKFCTSCGTKVIDKPVKPTCPGCAGEISESLKFCTNCGQKL